MLGKTSGSPVGIVASVRETIAEAGIGIFYAPVYAARVPAPVV